MLAIARSDIEETMAICRLFILRVKSVRNKLYDPLLTAIIVCYSRVFLKNRPFGVLPKKWGRFASPILQQTHNTILEQRKKAIAHSDLEFRRVLIVPTYNPSDPMGIIISGSVLHPNIVPEILGLCTDLKSRLDTEIEQKLKFIYAGKQWSPEDFELINNF